MYICQCVPVCMFSTIFIDSNNYFSPLTVVLFIISIVVFPSGIGSDGVRHPQLCGSSAGSFQLGDCTLGWAYILAVVGTSIGVVAAGLSWTACYWKEKNKEGEYTI